MAKEKTEEPLKIFTGLLVRENWVINGEWKAKIVDNKLYCAEIGHKSKHYATYECDVPPNLKGGYNYILGVVGELKRKIKDEIIGVDNDSEPLILFERKQNTTWNHTPWEKLTPRQRTKAIEIYVENNKQELVKRYGS